MGLHRQPNHVSDPDELRVILGTLHSGDESHLTASAPDLAVDHRRRLSHSVIVTPAGAARHPGVHIERDVRPEALVSSATAPGRPTAISVLSGPSAWPEARQAVDVDPAGVDVVEELTGPTAALRAHHRTPGRRPPDRRARCAAEPGRPGRWPVRWSWSRSCS